MKKYISKVIGLVMSLLAVYISWMSVDSGFPDGYISPYDRFYNQYLFPIFTSIHAIFLLLFVGAFFFKRNQCNATYLLLVYIALVMLSILTNYYYYATMDHGQGG